MAALVALAGLFAVTQPSEVDIAMRTAATGLRLLPQATAQPSEASSTSQAGPTLARNPFLGLLPIQIGKPDPTPTPRPTRELIVAPDGTADGAGTLADPLDLQTALRHDGGALPGDQILLRGGVYRGSFLSTVKGTQSAPVVVRSHPGEWAIIDSGLAQKAALIVAGQDTTVRDLEVMRSDPRRVSEDPGSQPGDLQGGRPAGVDVYADRAKLINLVIHDNGNGVGLWRQANNVEIIGSIIYNNGWIGPDRGHGHGVYVQNDQGTERIVDTVVFNNFGHGVQAYDIDLPITNVTIEGVISFENGAPDGTNIRQANILAATESARVDAIRITDSIAYHRSGNDGHNVRVANKRPMNLFNPTAAWLEGNTIIGGSTAVVIEGINDLRVTGNELGIRPNANGNPTRFVDVTVPGLFGSGNYTWDRNDYHDLNTVPDNLSFWLGRERFTFSAWRGTTGYDGNSAHARTNGSERVIVRPIPGERGRAHIVVRDPESSSVSLDLSATGLEVGEAFEIRDIEHLRAGPIVTGTWDGGPVSLPLDASTVAQPIGLDTALEHTPSEFGAYLLLPRH